MKTLKIELPGALAARIEDLVEEGRFTSEAEVVRLALADYLRRRPFELEERFQRADIAWASAGAGLHPPGLPRDLLSCLPHGTC